MPNTFGTTGETVVEQPDGPRAPIVATRPRQLAVAGLSLIALGLFTLVLGVVLGFMEYNSPLEVGIRTALKAATSDVTGMQLEGGEQIVSVAPYPIPGPSAYVLGQRATWIGLLIAFVGLAIYLRSRVGDQTPAEAIDRVNVPEVSDEPFDLE